MLLAKLNHGFNRLLWAQFISKIGNFTHEVIFSMLIIQLSHHDYFMMGLVYFFRFFTFIFFGPICGILVNDVCPKRVMLIADFTRGCLGLVLAYTIYNQEISVFILGLWGVIFSIFRACYQPALQLFMANLIEQHSIIKGNSLIRLLDRLAFLLGPLLTTIILWKADQLYFAILFDALTFFLSFAFILKIVLNLRPRHQAMKIILAYQTLYQQLRLLVANKKLFIPLVYSSSCLLISGYFVKLMLPAHIYQLFCHSDVALGLANTIIALGAVIGCLIFAYARVTISLKTLKICWLLQAGGLTCIALFFNSPQLIRPLS